MASEDCGDAAALQVLPGAAQAGHRHGHHQDGGARPDAWPALGARVRKRASIVNRSCRKHPILVANEGRTLEVTLSLQQATLMMNPKNMSGH